MHFPQKTYAYAIFALALSLFVSSAPAQATFTVLGPFPIMTTTFGVGTIPVVPPTTNSPSPWVFTSSNTKVAVISGKMINVVGVGTSTVTASQAASGNFTARSRSTQVRVSQGTPVLGVYSPQSIAITQRTYALTPPTSTSDGAWSFTSTNSNIALVVGSKITFKSPGKVLINATQGSTSNWKMATTSMNLTIVAIAPVLGTFSDITIMKESVSSLSLNPPASTSSAPWIFTSSDPGVASVVSNVVTPHTSGTTVITATQSPAGDYGSATTSMKLTLQGPLPTSSPSPSATPTTSPSPTPKPSATPTTTATPRPTPTVKPTITPTPLPSPSTTKPPINTTLKVTASGRVLTVVAIGVKPLVFINGKPGKVGINAVAPGTASVVITIDDKVVYRRVFSIK